MGGKAASNLHQAGVAAEDRYGVDNVLGGDPGTDSCADVFQRTGDVLQRISNASRDVRELLGPRGVVVDDRGRVPRRGSFQVRGPRRAMATDWANRARSAHLRALA
jgi:hypothetical protein